MSIYCCVCLAQTDKSMTDSIFTAGELTVTGRRIPTNVLASAPLQTLTRTDLLNMGISDMATALRHFTGVSVRDYGGIGGLKTVSIRGLGAQHTGVIYDGVSIGDCQSGQVDISRFTLDNISLIYVTIGQQDDIFQSARALAAAGTLYIETMTDKETPLLTACLKGGSYGYIEPSALFSVKASERLAMTAFGSYSRADGNYHFTMRNGIKEISEKRHNSDIESWRAELNMMYDITTRQQLKAKVYGFSSHRGLPGSVIYDNPWAAERLTDKNFFAQALYTNTISNSLRLRSAVKWNYSWMRDFNIDAAGEHEDKFRQNETYATATVMYTPVKLLSLSLAQDYTHNYLSTTHINCPYPTRDSWHTAIAARLATESFTANASLLSTQINERVRTGDAAHGLHRISPAFSAAWQPFNKSDGWMKALRLRLAYKDIFRAPTLNDLYYRLIGNTSLRPEKTRQWNAGITWEHSMKGIVEGIILTADAHYGHTNDKIVAIPTLFIWKMMNVGKVVSRGVDITTSANIRWSSTATSDITMTYNYLRAADKTDPTTAYYNHQIAYTPKNSASLCATLHTPWVDMAYNLLFTGSRYASGYNTPDYRMHSFSDHSISLSRKQKIKSGTLRLQIDLNNLTGKNYEIVRFYPMPGRNIKASATYTL